jgi:hypothetical protein
MPNGTTHSRFQQQLATVIQPPPAADDRDRDKDCGLDAFDYKRPMAAYDWTPPMLAAFALTGKRSSATAVAAPQSRRRLGDTAC